MRSLWPEEEGKREEVKRNETEAVFKSELWINSPVYSVTCRPNVGHTVIQFSLTRLPFPASRSTPPSFFLLALFTLSAPLISALVHLLLARMHTQPTHTHFLALSPAFILAGFARCSRAPAPACVHTLTVYTFFINKSRGRFTASLIAHGQRIVYMELHIWLSNAALATERVLASPAVTISN